MKAFILLSGGIDSLACVNFYKALDYEVECIFCDYGQPASISEKQASQKIAVYYNVPYKIIEVKKRVSPKELQEDFCKLLQKRFPHTEINKGELAVTIKFSDYEVQLLPALRENGKIRIADREEHGWSSPINVSAFTSKLTKTNKINGNKVVPVIKLKIF